MGEAIVVILGIGAQGDRQQFARESWRNAQEHLSKIYHSMRGWNSTKSTPRSRASLCRPDMQQSAYEVVRKPRPAFPRMVRYCVLQFTIHPGLISIHGSLVCISCSSGASSACNPCFQDMEKLRVARAVVDQAPRGNERLRLIESEPLRPSYAPTHTFTRTLPCWHSNSSVTKQTKLAWGHKSLRS